MGTNILLNIIILMEGVRMANIKTNAMRILDSNNIEYNVLSYDNEDGKVDGISVANKIKRDVKTVFKTLVTYGKQEDIYVFVIPSDEELDLKKAAFVSKEKKIEFLNIKDIKKHTGYIRGGCSPIAMKKSYPTYIDKSALELEKIIVSAGKIGFQIELDIKDLIKVTNGELHDLIK